MFLDFLKAYSEDSSLKAGFLLAGIISGLVVAFWGSRRIPTELSRRSEVIIGVVLIALFVIEYCLGSSSFIYWDDEGDTAVPALISGARMLSEGRTFAHEWAGGNDPQAMLSNGLQFLAPERSLLAVAPLWVAIAAHKIFYAGLCLLGAGLLARRVAGVSAYIGMVLMSIWLLSNTKHWEVSLCHSVSWGVLPLVLYFFARRLWEPGPWLAILAMTVVLSMAEPVHLMPAVGLAAIVGLAFAPRIKPVLLVATLFLVILANAVNWQGQLMAMADLAPYTARASLEWSEINPTLGFRPLFKLCGLLALIVLGVRRDPLFGRSAVAYAIAVAAYLICPVFPWKSVGLNLAESLKWYRLTYVYDGLSIIVIARVLIIADAQWNFRWLPRPMAATVGLLVTMLVVQKGDHLFSFIHDGGQVQFDRIYNLAKPEWRGSDQSRTVTLAAWKPEANLVSGVYGIETFDGTLDLVARNLTAYWNWGIRVKGRGQLSQLPVWGIDPTFFDYDKEQYDAEKDISTHFLGIANVSHLISPVPLAGEHLTEVSAPSPRPHFGVIRTAEERKTYYSERLRDDVYGFNVFVYRIDRHLPLAFDAAGVRPVPDDMTDQQFIAEVGQYAADRTVVARASAAQVLEGPLGRVIVSRHERTPNGYRFDVESDSGGVLVVNVPFVPFWHATVDGKPVELADVNQIHMAIRVPPGAHTADFAYSRSSLGERLARLSGIAVNARAALPEAGRP